MTTLMGTLFQHYTAAEQRYKALAQQCGLNTGAQVMVLIALYEHDGQNAGQLATAVGRVSTSFTPVLDRVEAAGLVERVQRSVDRRCVTIRLTAQGEALRPILMPACAEIEAAIRAELQAWVTQELLALA